jgi:hypothetical protein
MTNGTLGLVQTKYTQNWSDQGLISVLHTVHVVGSRNKGCPRVLHDVLRDDNWSEFNYAVLNMRHIPHVVVYKDIW